MHKSIRHAFVNQVLVSTLVMICFTGSLGLGTVWLRHQISVAAGRQQQLELSLAEVERHLDETTAAIAAEQSPDALVRRDAEWRLGLVPPGEPQVVRVPGDVERRLAAKNRTGLYLGDSMGITAVVFQPGGAR